MSKVLHLRSSTGFWGPDRQLLQLVKPMRSQGFQLEILALHRPRDRRSAVHPLVDRARRDGLEADQVLDRRKFSPAVIFQIARRLERGGYALLHTHEYKSDILGVTAARLAGVACIASVGGYTDSTLSLRVYKYLDLVALRFFSRVIAASDSLREQLTRAGLPAEKVVTVRYGLDLPGFTRGLSQSRRVREQLRIQDAEPVVCIVGRLSAEKGHRYFLQAAAQILEVLPQTRFLVVGDGPLRDPLEVLARSLGIQDRVAFLGYREEVAAFLGASDVVAHASLTEGLGSVLLEALAVGKPVVATRVGGVPEIVRSGETGRLVPPGNAPQLARAILDLLRDPERAARLGERGRALVAQEFTMQATVRQIAALYREVLA